MAKIAEPWPKGSAVGTKTTRIVETLNAVIANEGYNPGDGIIVQGKQQVVYVDYPTSVPEKDILKFVNKLDVIYGILERDDVKKVYEVGKGTNKKRVRFEKTNPSGGGGVIPTPIQEEGSTIVLTQALVKDKKFTSEQSILGDKDTREKLEKCFKGWEHRLPLWTWTYYQQSKEMLKEYGKHSWAEFVYGPESFVKFFEIHMGNLRRDMDPEIVAGRYETWNPSDIWAVKRGQMDNIKKTLKKQIPEESQLLELNTILVGMMERNELVGISLKKVNSPSEAEIHLHNVETSPALKALKAFTPLEKFKMKDIHWEPDNILNLKSVTSYVRFGNDKKFSIDISRSGNNLSFNTAIARTPAARGGQAPIAMVGELVGGQKFNTSNAAYEADGPAFNKVATNKYKPMYDLVVKHRNPNAKIQAGAPKNWTEWKKGVVFLYAEDPRDAKATLMQLSFWHDAIKLHGKDAEFWTDILYYGMKVTAKGQFAPHAKIS